MKTVSLSRDKVHEGSLILVNRESPCVKAPDEKAVSTVAGEPYNARMERQAAVVLSKLMDELNVRESFAAVSGLRSRREQEEIYGKSWIEKGAEFTAKYVAFPGHSEHHTGLAVDLALNMPEIDELCPYFPYDGICGRFRELAGRFGFIERYPKGKEGVTGIAHEPWHFRYVGAPHSALMEQFGDTLEEYHARLKRYPLGKEPLRFTLGGSDIEISYLAADGNQTVFETDRYAVFTVSGNNTDGFIITKWNKRL